MVLAGKNSVLDDPFNIACFKDATKVVSWYVDLSILSQNF